MPPAGELHAPAGEAELWKEDVVRLRVQVARSRREALEKVRVNRPEEPVRRGIPHGERLPGRVRGE